MTAGYEESGEVVEMKVIEGVYFTTPRACILFAFSHAQPDRRSTCSGNCRHFDEIPYNTICS